MQFLLGLSDRQAAEAVRCRIDFEYGLSMELDDPGFRHSVLADFRERLARDECPDRLLNLALSRLVEVGLKEAASHASALRSGPTPPLFWPRCAT
ncbi:transposase [Streptomyces sp. NPDC096311]|uniref:transposase n=1 Tax=Streptomyces sp. NPDC096311 TaxID=3366083 RepID=UPI00380D64A1